MPPIGIEVDWHPGMAGQPVPESVSFGQRRVSVVEVIDHWPGEGYGYVKLRGGDGGIYVLRYGDNGKEWSLTLFRAPGHEAGLSGTTESTD